MIVTIKKDGNQAQVDNLLTWIKSIGLSTHVSKGENNTIEIGRAHV